jgi:hypothetical protein
MIVSGIGFRRCRPPDMTKSKGGAALIRVATGEANRYLIAAAHSSASSTNTAPFRSFNLDEFL